MPPKKKPLKEAASGKAANENGGPLENVLHTFKNEIKTKDVYKVAADETRKRGKRDAEHVEKKKKNEDDVEIVPVESDPSKRQPEKFLGSKLAKESNEDSFIAQRLRSNTNNIVKSIGGNSAGNSFKRELNTTFTLDEDILELMAQMGISDKTATKKIGAKSRTKTANSSNGVVAPDQVDKKKPSAKGKINVAEPEELIDNVENIDPNIGVVVTKRGRTRGKTIKSSKTAPIETVMLEDNTPLEVPGRTKGKKQVPVESPDILEIPQDTSNITRVRGKKNAATDIRHDLPNHENSDAQVPANSRAKKGTGNKTVTKEVENTSRGKEKKTTVHDLKERYPLYAHPLAQSNLKNPDIVAPENFNQNAKPNLKKEVNISKEKGKKQIANVSVEIKDSNTHKLKPIGAPQQTASRGKGRKVATRKDVAQSTSTNHLLSDTKLHKSTNRKLIEEESQDIKHKDVLSELGHYSPLSIFYQPQYCSHVGPSKRGQLFRGPRGEYVINSNLYQLSISIGPKPRILFKESA